MYEPVPHHVLYVEGEPPLRDDTAVALRARHPHLRVAGSVSEARAVAHAQRSWCGFIAAHRLPDGRGLALLEELRALHPAVPAALTTGDPSRGLANACYRAGVGYLVKPVGTSEWDAFVREAVELSGSVVLGALYRSIAATPRERDVLHLSLIEVKTVREIAEEPSPCRRLRTRWNCRARR